MGWKENLIGGKGCFNVGLPNNIISVEALSPLKIGERPARKMEAVYKRRF
jgi:hypothetical protein